MKKCNKCGIDYPDNTMFCPECGGQVVAAPQVQTHKLHCKNCNGTMDIEEGGLVLICPFCGSKELIAESDAVVVEKIKQKNHREIELGKQQLERERMEQEYEKAEEEKKANAIRKFKKSFMGVLLIVVGVISALFCLVSFNDRRILSGIVAIIIGALCVVSYLMGVQVIKEKFKGMRIIAAILAFVLIIPYFRLYEGGGTSYETKPENFEWNILDMSGYVPEPPSTYGTIGLDYNNHLSIDIFKISYAEYKAYRNECVDWGYDKDTSGGGNTYYAYNAEGYKLSLFYYEDDEKLGIVLRAPEEKIESTNIEETIVADIIETTSGDEMVVETVTQAPLETSVEVPMETTREFTSKYEKAFIRDMSNYDLYYMFNVDEKEVISFSTSDTYIQRGIYTGEFSSGVDINWINDGWHETFTCLNGSKKATLIDGHGYDWEYKVCTVEDAQKALDLINQGHKK